MTKEKGRLLIEMAWARQQPNTLKAILALNEGETGLEEHIPLEVLYAGQKEWGFGSSLPEWEPKYGLTNPKEDRKEYLASRENLVNGKVVGYDEYRFTQTVYHLDGSKEESTVVTEDYWEL
jgi:hypothetical protein